MTVRLLLGVGACLLLCTAGVNSAQLPEGPLVIGKPGNRIVFRGQNADPLHVPGMGTLQTNHKTGEHAFVDEEETIGDNRELLPIQMHPIRKNTIPPHTLQEHPVQEFTLLPLVLWKQHHHEHLISERPTSLASSP
ncbi:hypothetical protein ACLKA6_006967 [Drosophila palustris]